MHCLTGNSGNGFIIFKTNISNLFCLSDVDEITEEEKRSKKDGEVELIDVDKAPAELFAVDMAKES